MARHPRPAITRLVWGSVPDQVMRKAACPVLAPPARRHDREHRPPDRWQTEIRQASGLAPGRGLWLSLCLIHCRSRRFTGGHRPAVHAGQEHRRTLMNAQAQYSKACEGATLPWVQIPPPPLLTCDDESPPCLLRGDGHRGGLSFGPQMVSVDRAEIPAAGCIGPELRPCTAADAMRSRPRQIPIGAGRSPRPGRRARQAGCRLSFLRPGRQSHARAAEACTVPFRPGRTVRHRVPANLPSASH
jgi:hypothetical protein